MLQMCKRLAWLRLVLVLLFCVTAVYLAWLIEKPEWVETASQQGTYTCLAGTANGMIYDRNGEPLVNQTVVCNAVVCPTAEVIEAVLPHVLDVDAFYEQAEEGKPFVCQVDTAEIACENVTVLEIPQRYSSHQIAQHLIGYTANGAGVTGLEYAYDSVLRSETARWSVTFSVDGTGSALAGELVQVRYGANPTDGVITTLDARIQRICETAGQALGKGCVVVMDVDSGDVLAMARFPSYTIDQLSEVLDDSDSPLINRALYAYPVGSIFKLVTAACAYDSGIATSFQWDCTGSISIGTQAFHCHDLTGHGVQNMLDAMRNSCNPYFIALSQSLSGTALLDTAWALGFGSEIVLAADLTASGGTLPTTEQLDILAERANFCFGHGVLTATPLQITRITCAIAGDGSLPMGRLVRGITEDGRTIAQEEEVVHTAGILAETARFLRNLMCYAAADEDFQGNPGGFAMGAKTSTAQTGRYDENGTEYCHGWVTAFFPAQDLQYAVTVLAEDGGYGNDSAAPVLREIAGAILE
ncbi:MAG: hypothetical protein LUC50_01710 [Ruminococcus sp.]|nr:hypothetical protein [Ruminococcus sp.]